MGSNSLFPNASKEKEQVQFSYFEVYFIRGIWKIQHHDIKLILKLAQKYILILCNHILLSLYKSWLEIVVKQIAIDVLHEHFCSIFKVRSQKVNDGIRKRKFSS